MKHISVQAFKEVVEAEKNNPSVDFINVCTPIEYKEKHIPGVRSVPFDELANRIGEFSNKQTVYVHCRAGRRSQQAVEKLVALGVTAEMVNVEGGLSAWDEAGFVTTSQAVRMPLMQQTMLSAGSLILVSFALSMTVHPAFIYLAGFIGLGLTFAGLTGWCGMSYALAKMPWNK